jgi:cell division protein FtsB
VSARAQPARGYRLRPAPRGARRRGSSRVQWDKVGRVALVLVLIGILASYVKPALNFWDAWQGSKAEHASVAQLREENVVLKQRIASLAGPDAAERAARKLGMVASGEASYVVRGLDH